MNRAFLHSFLSYNNNGTLTATQTGKERQTGDLSAVSYGLGHLCSTLPSRIANTGMSDLDFISIHEERSTDFYSCPFRAFRINVSVYYNNQTHNIHHKNCTFYSVLTAPTV